MKAIQEKSLTISIGLLVLFQAVLVIYQLVNEHYYTLDSFEYLNSAKNLLETGIPYSGSFSESINPDLYTRRPPFYAIFLLVSSAFTLNIKSIIIFQNILFILTIGLFDRFILKQNLTRKQRILFYSFLLVSPSFLIYANLVMSEILLAFLLIIYVLSIQKLKNSKNQFAYLRTGFYQVLLMFTKPVFYLFWIIQALYLWLINKKISIKIIGPTLLSIGAIVLFTLYNYSFTGSSQFSSMQKIGFVNYNAFYFQIEQIGLENANNWIDSVETQSKVLFPESYADQSKYQMKASVSFCIDRPFSYSIYYAKGIIAFMLDPGRFDLYNFLGIDELGYSGLMKSIRSEGLSAISNYLTIQPIGLMLLLGLFLFVNGIKMIGYFVYLMGFKQFNYLEVIMVILFLYVAVLTGPNGASRYMVPVLLFYLFGAIKGLSKIKSMLIST
ncbi:MAG: hypothetical protein GW823_06675 [Bacteroidetes bacterium]|nr:hypothetical protein [Bacteroidota bacterium]